MKQNRNTASSSHQPPPAGGGFRQVCRQTPEEKSAMSRRKNQPKGDFGTWIGFFLGTPQRFLLTLTGIGLIVVVTNPGLLQSAVSQFVQEASPLVGLTLTLIIVFFGIKIVLGAFKK